MRTLSRIRRKLVTTAMDVNFSLFWTFAAFRPLDFINYL